ncbi:uncharacterized protein LOC143854809 [Tasmannia lanceolata]|uniref:uncharacterized protein LOC143854809 n=1 Tax=Tasmannia lanceolata TaxID=3420 RepID=UPI004064B96D
MASNMLQPQLLRFNGKNYNQWSIQMKVLYGSQYLWDIIENDIEEPEDQAALTLQQLNELKDNRKKDTKALFFIYQAVDKVIFERISSMTSAKEACDTLYTSYKGEDKVKLVRLQTLRCEFDALRMKDSELVEDFYNRVISLVNQLRKDESKEDETYFLACNVQEEAFDETWYLVSDCSNHMTGNKGVFVKLDESLQSEVRTGDDMRLFERGSDDILVQTKKGVERISNVFYVPGLKHNLLSVGQLLMKGHDVHFKEDVCEIKVKNHILIAKVRMTQNKMFPLKFQIEGL